MTDDALSAAKSRRKAMYDAMIDVENAVQAPTGTGIWATTLLTELAHLSEALDHHVDTVEAGDGIIAKAVKDAPRLDGHGTRLRDDHVLLRQLVATATDLAEQAATPIPDDAADEIRDAILELLNGLTRHRHQGSNFVWEAYAVDIGRGA
jgi:hypothetical protein